jgi:Holliday junction resolvase RusA-like endonuclease
MTDTLQFFVPLVPVGQMRARSRAVRGQGGKIYAQVYKDSEQEAREKMLREYLVKHAPAVPWLCPLELGLKMFMPIPPSWSKKKQEQARMGMIRPTVTPDTSNCIKHIEDVGNGILWGDDKQIVGYLPGIGKYYSDRVGWQVTVEKWVPSGGLMDLVA